MYNGHKIAVANMKVNIGGLSAKEFRCASHHNTATEIFNNSEELPWAACQDRFDIKYTEGALKY